MRLSEGMKPDDLKDTVQPVISVDEYESKIDASAIVFGFYVNDRDAANDLNRFIQKSAAEVLDTEVSPAFDQEGYFIVFVELLNNEHLVKDLDLIVHDLSPLCGIEAWKLRMRRAKAPVPYSSKTVTSYLSSLERTDEGAILDFLSDSDLFGAALTEGELVLQGTSGHAPERFRVHGLMHLQEALDYGAGTAFSTPGCGRSLLARHGGRVLGADWAVSKINNLLFLSHGESEHGLLIGMSNES